MRPRRRVHEGVLDEGAPDLQHALLVAEGKRAAVCRDVENVVGLQCHPHELRHCRLRDLVERHDLPLEIEVPCVQTGKIEQLGGELLEACDLLAHRLEELPPRGLVEILVVEQLEKAPEREDRRAQLV